MTPASTQTHVIRIWYKSGQFHGKLDRKMVCICPYVGLSTCTLCILGCVFIYKHITKVRDYFILITSANPYAMPTAAKYSDNALATHLQYFH